MKEGNTEAEKGKDRGRIPQGDKIRGKQRKVGHVMGM
jgi:hypothetical protein